MKKPSRKEFLTGVAGATVTLLFAACGGADNEEGDNTGGPDGNCTNGVDVTITGNHGHALKIDAADFGAGQSKTYSISGTSQHDHSVTLTAQDFADLQSGKTITKESTNTAGHSHPMQLAC
jgi:hypothetical protein